MIMTLLELDFSKITDETIIISNNIKTIKFCNVNKPLLTYNYPDTIEEIIFDDKYDQSITSIKWPLNLKKIVFGNRFNQDFGHIEFPPNLEIIIIQNPKFCRTFRNVKFNKDIKLCFAYFNPKYMSNLLPDCLEKLAVYRMNQHNELNNLPTSLKELILNQLEINWLTRFGFFDKLKLPFNCKLKFIKMTKTTESILNESEKKWLTKSRPLDYEIKFIETTNLKEKDFFIKCFE